MNKIQYSEVIPTITKSLINCDIMQAPDAGAKPEEEI
jgi:hypothetical protein